MKTQTCFKPSPIEDGWKKFASGSPKPTWTFTRDLSLFDLIWLLWVTPIHHSTPVKWQFGDVPHSWRYPNVSSWWVIFHVVYPIAITCMVHPCRKACWNLHGTFPREKNNQNVVFFPWIFGVPHVWTNPNTTLGASRGWVHVCLDDLWNRQKGVEDDCVYLQQPRIPQKWDLVIDLFPAKALTFSAFYIS